MSLICREVPLAELSPLARAHRRRWQTGMETAVVTYRGTTLGVIVSLDIFSILSIEVVAGMPLRDLQLWLWQNQQGWREGIMDGLTLTWHKQDVLGFVHPRHATRLLMPQQRERGEADRRGRLESNTPRASLHFSNPPRSQFLY